MPTKLLIYGLFDPRDGQLRYVGKTEGALNTRLNHHVHRALKQKTNTYKANWIRSVIAAGHRPEIVELEAAESAEALVEAEVWNIAHWRSLGCRLTNLTGGGEGASGYRHTEETKARLSEMLKGKPGRRAGKKHTAEARAQVSRTKTGLNEEQEVAIAARYASGLDARTVAAEFGVSDTAVFNIVRRLGGRVRTQAETIRKLSPDQEQAAMAMYAQGLSSAVVGKAFDVSSTAILNMLRRHGLSRRTAAKLGKSNGYDF